MIAQIMLRLVINFPEQENLETEWDRLERFVSVLK